MALNTFITFQTEKMFIREYEFSDDTMISTESRFSLMEFEGAAWRTPVEDIFCFGFKEKYNYYDTVYHKINCVSQCYTNFKLNYVADTINQMRIDHKVKMYILSRKKVVQFGRRIPLKKSVLKIILEMTSYIKINTNISVLGTVIKRCLLKRAHKRLVLLNGFTNSKLIDLYERAKYFNTFKVELKPEHLINIELKY